MIYKIVRDGRVLEEKASRLRQSPSEIMSRALEEYGPQVEWELVHGNAIEQLAWKAADIPWSIVRESMRGKPIVVNGTKYVDSAQAIEVITNDPSDQLVFSRENGIMHVVVSRSSHYPAQKKNM